MLQHFEGDIVLAYHSVTQGADCKNVLRRSPEHHLRFPADLKYFAGVRFKRHNRRLGKNDTLAADVNEHRSRAEVYANILSE